MEYCNVIGRDDFHQFLEEPWKVGFLSLMRPTVMEDLIQSGPNFSVSTPGFVKMHWTDIMGDTLVDPFRLGCLTDVLQRVRDVPGDIVECGCYRGGTGILMALFLEKHGLDKHVHLFDSFAGLPEVHMQKDKGYKKGQFRSDLDALRMKIETLGLCHRIRIHPGWFNETVSKFLRTNPVISLLHVDCDLYTSTNDCFPALYPRVSTGGAVVMDDFNDGGRGEKLAILEELSSEQVLIHIGPAPQAHFYKGEALPAERRHIVSDAGFYYSFEELLKNHGYLSWISEVLEYDYGQKIKTY